MRTTGSREVYRNPWMRVREDTIELADGSASLAVVLRPEVHARGEGLVDISDSGGWRAYQASPGHR